MLCRIYNALILVSKFITRGNALAIEKLLYGASGALQRGIMEQVDTANKTTISWKGKGEEDMAKTIRKKE